MGQLDYYLPLPGLLDPSLNEILSPLMAVLSTHLTRLSDDEGNVNPALLARVGRLINWVVKVRGWKAVGKLGVLKYANASPTLSFQHPSSTVAHLSFLPSE